jgi:hypothetical protein
MHRGFYVGFVLVPLVLGLIFLIFAVSTEYWTSLDYSQTANLQRNLSTGEAKKNYVIKKVRFEFPKYTSLFGECDEYKQIEILEPVNVEQIVYITDGNPNATMIEKYTSLKNQGDDSGDDSNGPGGSERKCLSMDECTELNKFKTDSCFCCESIARSPNPSDKCCHLRSKLCDGVTNCKDRADELNDCPIRKLFYSTQYYDNKHNCLRSQYSLYKFTLGLINHYVLKPGQDPTNQYCLQRLFESQSYSVRIFSLRLLTLTCLLLCVIFTVCGMLTLLCVICCHNLTPSKEKRLQSSVDQINELNYNGHSDEEQSDTGGDVSKKARRNCCCKCNCLLCPFVFYSIFSLLAFITVLAALVVYTFSLCYARNVYLIYDLDFLPDYMTRAYQHNAWLFDIQRLGLSYYALLVSVGFYLLSFVACVSISCRIQMSPSWRSRHTESYEVLQMHDIVFNKKKASVKKSNSYIKLCKESGGGGGNGGGSNSSTAKNSDKEVAVVVTTRSSNGNKYVNLTNNGVKCPEATPEDDESGGEGTALTSK